MVTLILLALMLVSGTVGYFLRKRQAIILFASRFITYVVYVLLCVMGIAVGLNRELFVQLPRVGLQSIVITVGALAGTIFFAWIFGRFVIKTPKTSENTEQPKENTPKAQNRAWLKVVESLSFFAIFLVGVLLGRYIPPLADFFSDGNIDTIIVALLYTLMICVGLSTGGNEGTFKALRGMGVRPLLLPVFTVVGTALGVLIAWPFFPDLTLSNVEVVGVGYAYYSLSSILIGSSEIPNCELIAAIALVSNIIRELSTIMLAPLYVRLGGVYAPICCAGATSGDTVLPFILQATSPQYAVVSVYHGIVLTFFVPFAVPLALLL